MHSGQHKDKISDIVTVGFGQQFVGQSQIWGLNCSTGFMAECVGLAAGPRTLRAFM